MPPRLRESSGGKLPRHLRPVFRDRDELPSAASLPDVVHHALEQSEALIVICSPAAASSPWVNDEIHTFQKLGRGDRIFCLIVDGEPHAGDERECFPPALLEHFDREGRRLDDVTEPIAADLRPGQDSRQRAKLRIIAGLLGIGLDELLQREAHRRHRRLFALATAATLVALVMAGLATFAFLSSAEAERQRAAAENLVGFMLGDLREKLTEIGRLDVYDAVGDKSMEYFKSLDPEDARDEVLAQRAVALRQIGAARLDQGDMGAALESFDEALQISTELAARDPDRDDWQVGLAESLFYVGLVHWQRGEIDEAGRYFLRQVEVVDALSAAELGNVEHLSARLYAWTNYGRVLELAGRFEQAQQAYQSVMDAAQRLVVLDADELEWQLELGFAHNNLGKLKASLGRLREAQEHYRTDLAIKQELLSTNPAHNLWREYLGVSHHYMGRVQQQLGLDAEAIDQFELALGAFDHLLTVDSSVLPWRERRADTLRAMAVSQRRLGMANDAGATVAEALSELEMLTSTNPDNALWWRDLGLAQLEAAWQAVAAGDRERALARVQDCDRVLDRLGALGASDIETRKLQAAAELTAGDALLLADRGEEARQRWTAGWTLVADHFRDSPDPEVIEISAQLALRMGHAELAERWRADMERAGYRGRYPSSQPVPDAVASIAAE